jgi:shikimate kinase
VTTSTEYVRVLLVGFMGSGKSSVGRSLAKNLGWAFSDFDHEVRKRAGMSIPELFRRHGERLFRTMEEAVGRELLQRRRAVLASGGGWPCMPGRMELLPPGTLSVWLKVREEVVLSRVMRRKGSRPLLDVEDPMSRIQELMRAREPWYAMADWVIEADDPEPVAIARMIQSRLREPPGAGDP